MTEDTPKTLLVSESIHAAAKAEAALSRLTLREWVEEVLLAALRTVQEPAQEVQE